MPRFHVPCNVEISWTDYVDAENAEEAEAIAKKKWEKNEYEFRGPAQRLLSDEGHFFTGRVREKVEDLDIDDTGGTDKCERCGRTRDGHSLMAGMHERGACAQFVGKRIK